MDQLRLANWRIFPHGMAAGFITAFVVHIAADNALATILSYVAVITAFYLIKRRDEP